MILNEIHTLDVKKKEIGKGFAELYCARLSGLQ